MLSKKWILTDHLSPTSSQYLKSALYSYFNVQRPLTPQSISKGYHFLYFNPKSEESELSFDGYDSHQAPAEPFQRRLWVSGELKFLKDLKFGKQSFCVETVERLRKIKDSNLVTIKREILGDEGDVCLVEQRSLLYLNELYDPAKVVKRKSNKQLQFSHALTPTDILLFRYSALTFNSHKIHYDKLYVKEEGYPNLLVHGPLTVTLMLEWIQSLNDEVITSFRYKNIKPLFAGEEMTLCLGKEVEEGKLDVWIESKDGHVAFEGLIGYKV